MIQRLLKEPLVHFLLIGLVLFFIFNVVQPDDRDRTIIIDEYDLNEVISKWNAQWQREPTTDELKALLDNYIKEEIYYREALAMNLDHNDEIIRRRLAQKMKFLSQDITDAMEIRDEVLQEFLDSNPEKFQTEKLISFEQKFFSRDHSADPSQRAMQALSDENINGDSSPVPEDFESTPLFDIRRQFGQAFANSIDSLEARQQWQGPVASGLGMHLILIKEVIPPRIKTLEEAREEILNEYRYELREQFNEDIIESLQSKYEIILKLDDKLLEE